MLRICELYNTGRFCFGFVNFIIQGAFCGFFNSIIQGGFFVDL
jgi:hypothetical protein